MKLLLTSGGVTNPSIRAALVDLLGKPVEEASVLLVPTAEHGHPWCTPQSLFRFVSGHGDLPWARTGVLELTAIPSVADDRWRDWVQEADVLFVDGGDALFLCHWIRESGLAELIPSLTDTVWVGVSAGSMVMTPRIGAEFTSWRPADGDERTLGLVDFSIFPHLDHPEMPENTLAAAERWATAIDGPAYAIDDQTAIQVVDGVPTVISEGSWHQLS